jgi:TRAP-type C4-dicarboxylate transport system permease large subunit
VFIYETLTLTAILEELISTAKLTAVILFAIGTASIYGWVFSYYRVPASLVAFLGTLTQNPTLTLSLATFCFLVAGCFMDAVPIIILLGPLLQPVVVKVGVDPLHFAIVSAVTLGIGLITPPFGLTLLISSKIAGINCMQPMKEVGLFFLVMLGIVVAMILLPDVFLLLPRMIR